MRIYNRKHFQIHNRTSDEMMSLRINVLDPGISINYRSVKSHQVIFNDGGPHHEVIFTGRKRDYQLEHIKTVGEKNLYCLTYNNPELQKTEVTHFWDGGFRNLYPGCNIDNLDSGEVTFNGNFIAPMVLVQDDDDINNALDACADFFRTCSDLVNTNTDMFTEYADFYAGLKDLLNMEVALPDYSSRHEIPMWLDNRSGVVRSFITMLVLGRDRIAGDGPSNLSKLLVETYGVHFDNNPASYSNIRDRILKSGFGAELFSTSGRFNIDFEKSMMQCFFEVKTHTLLFWRNLSERNSLGMYQNQDWGGIFKVLGLSLHDSKSGSQLEIPEYPSQLMAENFYEGFMNKLNRLSQQLSVHDISEDVPASAIAIRANIAEEEFIEFERFIREDSILNRLDIKDIEFVQSNRAGLTMRVTVDPRVLVPNRVIYDRNNIVLLTEEERDGFVGKWLQGDFLLHMKSLNSINRAAIYVNPDNYDNSYLVNVFNEPTSTMVTEKDGTQKGYYRYCFGDGETTMERLDTMLNVNFISPVNSDRLKFKRIYNLGRLHQV